ncbi:MAG: IS66 family insertion sequence element accessory protein TnpB [Betaproteobacteria bacterium]
MANGLGRRGSAVAPPTFGDITIYLAQEPVDFRLGINGLSVLVEGSLAFDPFSRNLFCFTNKRKNQIKVLYWQRTGFCLWQKRLEEERFKWPVHLPPLVRASGTALDARASGTTRPPVVELDEEQFRWLLDGLDLKHLKPHRSLEYRSVL